MLRYCAPRNVNVLVFLFSPLSVHFESGGFGFMLCFRNENHEASKDIFFACYSVSSFFVSLIFGYPRVAVIVLVAFISACLCLFAFS